MGDLKLDWSELGTTTDGGTIYVKLADPDWTHDGAVTIGQALDHLDPPIPRRTLARILAKLTPVGRAALEHGGPAARTYRYSDVLRAHADWARRKSQDSFL